MSLVVPPNFQHILRVLNTNIDGKTSVMFALTSIKGIGRRYANLCLKKADIPLSRRAGELNEEEVEKLVTIMQVGVSMPVQCCILFEDIEVSVYHNFSLFRILASTRSRTGS